MIAFIHGTLAEKKIPYAVIEAGGVGYQLEVSLFTFEQLPDINTEVHLLASQVIRDDAHLLYGFLSTDERSLFATITKVRGFGPRVAMSMLSAMRPSELAEAIQQSNKAMLQKIPGIGAKSAERLLIELRDTLTGVTTDTTVAAIDYATTSPGYAEAALVYLGYKPGEVNKVIRTLDQTLDTASLVRMALKQLSPNA